MDYQLHDAIVCSCVHGAFLCIIYQDSPLSGHLEFVFLEIHLEVISSENYQGEEVAFLIFLDGHRERERRIIYLGLMAKT